MKKINVTVWNENHHEKELRDKAVLSVYPEGIHSAIAGFLSKNPALSVKTATMDQGEHGLTDEVLDETDVLVWWSHMVHGNVSDAVADKVVDHVRRGMGFIPLHSSHWSKPFMRLMGTTCTLRWREDAGKERLWVIEPSHPVADGLPPYFELPHEEMYGERFDVPPPEQIVLMGWFQGGELFRSGNCYTRGYGKIFYFQPGHETHPTYHDSNIQKVITNAVLWAAPRVKVDEIPQLNPPALEKMG